MPSPACSLDCSINKQPLSLASAAVCLASSSGLHHLTGHPTCPSCASTLNTSLSSLTESLVPQRSTLDAELSTLIPQPSSLSSQPSALIPQPVARASSLSSHLPPLCLNPHPSSLQPSTLSPTPLNPKHGVLRYMSTAPQRVYVVQRVLHMRGRDHACQRGCVRAHVWIRASVTMSRYVRAHECVCGWVGACVCVCTHVRVCVCVRVSVRVSMYMCKAPIHAKQSNHFE